jgi:serine/threonine protein kinase
MGIILYVVGGLGITIPVVICMILAIWYKPALRRMLLKCGCVWFANCLVPELETRVDDIEKYMAKQKLPRLRDFTPEIDPSEVDLDRDDVLGTGGYGTVYLARYAGEKVAVKAMFEGDSNRVPTYAAKLMRNEAMIMCSLNHPNILRVFGVVTKLGYIVMELCPGGALDEYLYDPDNVLDARDKARLATETATGMAYLHMREVDIVHGDMKAGNVLLAADNSVRICDFGMSDAKNRSKTMTSAVAAGGRSVALTVAWSAPELFKGKNKTSSSDMYALGLTIWQIYERAQPFGSMPEAAIVSQVIGGTRPDYSQTPPPVKKIINLCWSKEAKDRPPADKVACAFNQLYESISRSKSYSGRVHPAPNFNEELDAMNERQSEIDSQHERSKAKFMRKVSMAKLTGRGKSKVHAETRSDADSAQAAEGIVAAPGDSAELGAILEAETEDAPPADAVIDMTAFTVHEPASPLFEDEDAEVAPPPPQPPVEPEAPAPPPVEEDAPVPPPPDDDDAPPPPPGD